MTGILDTIGNTALVELTKFRPENGARLLLKLEGQNPTGSMKDRMAYAMITAARADGRLKPGQRVVEYTGGSTGVSLAFVCAALDHPISIVTSDAFSAEKRQQMKAFGAQLHLIPSDSGGMDESLTRAMIAKADAIQKATGAFWTDQLNNTDSLHGYHGLADEILTQTDGRVDGFVQSVGTAGSVRGVAERFREHGLAVHIVAVEPEESAVLSGGPSGSHKIEGVGAGFMVPLWQAKQVDEIALISTSRAMDTARALARTEGIFAGTSTGANLAAAHDLALRLGPGKTIVTLMCDTGLKYISMPLYADLQVGETF
jgi:cysteine synthase